MLTRLCVDEQASCLVCPSCLVLAGILGLLVIPFFTRFYRFFLISQLLVRRPSNAVSRSPHIHFLNDNVMLYCKVRA